MFSISKRVKWLIVITCFILIYWFHPQIDVFLGRTSFKPEGWAEEFDGFYPNRLYMVDDLMENHLSIGMHIDSIISKLGRPQNFHLDQKSNKKYFLVEEHYRWNIDPDYWDVIQVELDANNRALSFERIRR